MVGIPNGTTAQLRIVAGSLFFFCWVGIAPKIESHSLNKSTFQTWQTLHPHSISISHFVLSCFDAMQKGSLLDSISANNVFYHLTIDFCLFVYNCEKERKKWRDFSFKHTYHRPTAITTCMSICFCLSRLMLCVGNTKMVRNALWLAMKC